MAAETLPTAQIIDVAARQHIDITAGDQDLPFAEVADAWASVFVNCTVPV